MKRLTQRLTFLMAGIICFQSMCIKTQAAAEVSLVRESMIVEKDTIFTDITTAPAVRITFTDAVKNGDAYNEEIFYVQVSNAEFTDEMFSPQVIDAIGAAKIEKQGKDEIKVFIKPTSNDRPYIIPLLVRLTGKQASVAVKGYGGSTTVSEWNNGETTIKEEKKDTATEESKADNNEPANEKDKESVATNTISFTLGQKTFIYNGESQTMDGAMYIVSPGYTMVPVRYVAKVTGIAESHIKFEKGKAHLNLKNGKTLTLIENSKVCLLDDEKITLDTPAIIKDGRFYVPVGQIARILEVKTTWDAQTKTATFNN